MEEHYDDGYGQAEAEAQYCEYLDQLCKDGEYYLFALYTAIDLLNSFEFKTSGKSAEQYLSEKMAAYLKRKAAPVEIKQTSLESTDGDLPF